MDETVVLDLSETLGRADGDQDFFLTLARLFLQESPKEETAARVALGRQGKFAEASSVCADVETYLAEVHAALRELIAGGLPP